MIPNAFDYKTNRFYLKSSNVTFDLQLRGYKNIVGENSGTGKTLLYKTIENFKELEESGAAKYSVQNITALNRRADRKKLFEFLNVTENLIIIDNADHLLRGRQDVINQIIEDNNNVYLIFSRAVEFEISLNYYARFEKNSDGIITISYEFNQGGWF